MNLSTTVVEVKSGDGSSEAQAVVIEFSTGKGHTLWRLPVESAEEAERIKGSIAAKIREVLDQEEADWSESGGWLKKGKSQTATVMVFEDRSRFGEAEKGAERQCRSANGA